MILVLLLLLFLPAEAQIMSSPSPSPTPVPTPAAILPDLSQFAVSERCPLIFKLPKSELQFFDYYPRDKKPINGVTRVLHGMAIKTDNVINGWGVFYTTKAPERDNRDFMILKQESDGHLRYMSVKELADLIEFNITDWHINIIRMTRMC